jgi:hypothetical protein
MSETRPRNSADQDPDDHPDVTAHECSRERTVFTENGNNDGWIATDLTVPLRR